jgi:hypothetical protein
MYCQNDPCRDGSSVLHKVNWKGKERDGVARPYAAQVLVNSKDLEHGLISLNPDSDPLLVVGTLGKLFCMP